MRRVPVTTYASCRSCGAPIVWALTESGKRIPLDAKPTKRILLDVAMTKTGEAVAVMRDTYMPHQHATCPKAASFRSANAACR